MFDSVSIQGVKIPEEILRFKEQVIDDPGKYAAFMEDIKMKQRERAKTLGRIPREMIRPLGYIQVEGLRASAQLAAVSLAGFTYKMTDADTMILKPKEGGKPILVRLSGIDAPETPHGTDVRIDPMASLRIGHGQPWGTEAAQEAKMKLWSIPDPILIFNPKHMKYGRYVGVIGSASDRTRNLNLELLKEGLGQFLPYGKEADEVIDRGEFARAEQNARAERRGMWSHPHWEAYDWLRAGAGTSVTFNTMNRIDKLAKNLNFAAAVVFMDEYKPSDINRARAFSLGRYIGFNPDDRQNYLPLTSLGDSKEQSAALFDFSNASSYIAGGLVAAATIASMTFFGAQVYKYGSLAPLLEKVQHTPVSPFLKGVSLQLRRLLHAGSELVTVGENIVRGIADELSAMNAKDMILSKGDQLLWMDIETTLGKAFHDSGMKFGSIHQVAMVYQGGKKAGRKRLFVFRNPELDKEFEESVNHGSEIFGELRRSHERVVDASGKLQRDAAGNAFKHEIDDVEIIAFDNEADMLEAVMKELEDLEDTYSIAGHNVRAFDLSALAESAQSSTRHADRLGKYSAVIQNLMKDSRVLDTIDIAEGVAHRGLWHYAGDEFNTRAPFGFKNAHLMNLLGISEEELMKKYGVESYIWHDPIFDILAGVEMRNKILELAAKGYPHEELNLSAYLRAIEETGTSTQKEAIQNLRMKIEQSKELGPSEPYIYGGEVAEITPFKEALDNYFKHFDPSTWPSIVEKLDRKINGIFEKIYTRLEESVSPGIRDIGGRLHSFLEERNVAGYMVAGAVGMEITPWFIPYMVIKGGLDSVFGGSDKDLSTVKSNLKDYEHILRERGAKSSDINGMALYRYRHRKNSHRMTAQPQTCSFCAGTGCPFCGG